MSDPINLSEERFKRWPHLAGEAMCIACKHVWAAVAPVGTMQLECPACKAERGQWRYPFNADTGQQIFICNTCNSTNFAVQPHRVLCVGCGTSHYPWAEDVKP